MAETANEMTREVLEKVLKEKPKLYYRTPSLNNVLYIHRKGFKNLAGLEEFSGLKALYADGNGSQRRCMQQIDIASFFILIILFIYLFTCLFIYEKQYHPHDDNSNLLQGGLQMLQASLGCRAQGEGFGPWLGINVRFLAFKLFTGFVSAITKIEGLDNCTQLRTL